MLHIYAACTFHVWIHIHTHTRVHTGMLRRGSNNSALCEACSHVHTHTHTHIDTHTHVHTGVLGGGSNHSGDTFCSACIYVFFISMQHELMYAYIFTRIHVYTQGCSEEAVIIAAMLSVPHVFMYASYLCSMYTHKKNNKH